jgi:hypothetical protein
VNAIAVLIATVKLVVATALMALLPLVQSPATGDVQQPTQLDVVGVSVDDCNQMGSSRRQSALTLTTSR